MSDWKIYNGKGDPHDAEFPEPPPWRKFEGKVLNTLQLDSETDSYSRRLLARGAVFQTSKEEVELVNAALYLRRPLLISGKPGSGKSSLAYSVARELKLGPVLRWSITSSTKLSDGLYHYDAIGRLQDASLNRDLGIGEYIRLGPLGAALLASEKPRTLLIDEIDKSDIDLPNDLLHVFEEGEFEIPELVRHTKEEKAVEAYFGKQSNAKVKIEEGHVLCREFPFVVLTSNEEREFPPAFLRRCLRLEMKSPNKKKLEDIVKAHLGEAVFPAADQLIDDFIKEGEKGNFLATDQLLNAIYFVSRGIDISRDKKELFQAVLRPLSNV